MKWTRTHLSKTYVMDDVEDLQDLEDYSNKDTVSPYEHDQLPNVEEIRMNAQRTLARGYKGPLSGGKGGSMGTFKTKSIILIGLLIVAILTSVGVTIGVRKKHEKQILAGLAANIDYNRYDRLIQSFAFNATDDFRSKDTYQSKAKAQILKEEEILVTATTEELRERYALYSLFHHTEPSHAFSKTHNRHYCHWHSITCAPMEDSQVVVKLDLKGQNMTGAMPPEASLLTHLRFLDVGGNPNLISVNQRLCVSQPPIDIRADCGDNGNVQCNCCTTCPMEGTR